MTSQMMYFDFRENFMIIYALHVCQRGRGVGALGGH